MWKLKALQFNKEAPFSDHIEIMCANEKQNEKAEKIILPLCRPVVKARSLNNVRTMKWYMQKYYFKNEKQQD